MTRIISISIIVLLVGAYFLFPGFQEQINEAYQIFTSDDRERITEYVQQFGAWGPVVIILTMIAQMFLFVVPSWLLMIVTVLAYGKFWGVVLSIAAVFVASTVGYFIGRGLSENTLNRLIGEENEKKLEDTLHQYGVGAVVIFRLAPFLSNDAISFVAGILNMSYWRFIAATLAGITPLAVLIAYFSEDTERLKSGLVWVGAISLMGYIGYIIYDKNKE
jgi:uncharacterized membrane protein YdjX (TVP38/TMEM64 family)